MTVSVQRGDLVRVDRYNAIGIVVDVFDDLDKKNPWIRVHFTTGSAAGTGRWCKTEGLKVIKKGDIDVPLPGVDKSGSL